MRAHHALDVSYNAHTHAGGNKTGGWETNSERGKSPTRQNPRKAVMATHMRAKQPGTTQTGSTTTPKPISRTKRRTREISSADRGRHVTQRSGEREKRGRARVWNERNGPSGRQSPSLPAWYAHVRQTHRGEDKPGDTPNASSLCRLSFCCFSTASGYAAILRGPGSPEVLPRALLQWQRRAVQREARELH